MKEYYKLASRYRQAIENVIADKRIPHKDRMSRFPNGCCDDACDLLSVYLDSHGIHTKQISGTYSDENPEHKQDHVWLLSDDEIVIDITGDQFVDRDELLNFAIPVYVGKEHALHRLFKDRKLRENYDFLNDPKPEAKRLKDDYQNIMRHITE